MSRIFHPPLWRFFRRRPAELRPCSPASITRLGSRLGRSEIREFRGTLVLVPKVGEPLLMHMGEDRRLVTSTIVRIDAANEGLLYVETRNSKYCVRVLSS
jgi:hypothetical protein